VPGPHAGATAGGRGSTRSSLGTRLHAAAQERGSARPGVLRQPFTGMDEF